MFADRFPQLVQSSPQAGADSNHRSGRRRGQSLCCLHLSLDALRTRQVGLVDYDHVGDFKQAGLLPLQIVARLWLQQQDKYIDEAANHGIALSGPNRFDEDHLETKRFKKADEEIKMLSQRPV